MGRSREDLGQMIPTLVIGGTHSGCGKTTLSCGIMAALVARGWRVQPFKVGPDFIDPTHHTAICGRPSRNLDPYMMGEEGVLRSFAQGCRDADVAIIEGVMGMFDGLEGKDLGSTAHVARILGAPIVLVVDVSGMSRSVHAILQGYTQYDPSITVAGAILNRVGSPHHRQMIEQSLTIPAFGWIPTEQERSVKSRHLGLHLGTEGNTMSSWGEVVEDHCSVDALLEIARVPDHPVPAGFVQEKATALRIGVAWDEAFCFYYQDNLDLLRTRGGKLVFFSPLRDSLPDVDALYLGGGYPELYASTLSSSPFTRALPTAAADGMPIYAECGGLVYLSRDLEDGVSHPMSGVLPAVAHMHPRFQALGYVEATSTGQSPILSQGIGFRGHEFHYSSLTCDRDARFALHLSRGKGIEGGKDGLCEHSVIGTYAHAYFQPSFADALLDAGRRWKKR